MSAITRVFSTFLLASLLQLDTQAAELKGVTLPDTLTVSGTPLQLNGLGVRQATIFKVSVYVGGLYVEAPATDPAALLAAKGKKALVMKFLRDVEKAKIDDSYREGFKKNCTEGCTTHEPALAQLLAVTSDVKKGDEMSLHFVDGSVEVFVGGSSKGKFGANGFDRAMLSIWLGKSPPNPELKDGLVGAKK